MKPIEGIQPARIFLLDGAGALLTCVLTIILAQYEAVFGIPSLTLYRLSGIALLMSVYSVLCSRFAKAKWPGWMRGIGSLNIAYAILSFYWCFHVNANISFWGKAYLMSEMLILITIGLFEWHLSLRKTGL